MHESRIVHHDLQTMPHDSEAMCHDLQSVQHVDRQMLYGS